MKTCTSITLLSGLLAIFLQSGCTTERGDRIWRVIDPAGYKHAHSESFNGDRALRAPMPKTDPQTEDLPLSSD